MLAAPKLRADLVFSPQVNGGETTFVVKDPAARRFFRFGEVEHFVARQLDGATSLDVVRNRVEARFDRPLRADTLEGLLNQFRHCQLLDGVREERANRGRSSLLYVRLKAFDPDRLLDRLAPRLCFVFTPAFVTCTALLVLLAMTVTIDRWTEVSHGVSGLYSFDALMIAWLTVLSVTLAHEFAHGLTCKHFGGHVHEIGFLLIYFQPAFYCNVSDSWLFPERSKRLWVMFAGAYLEIVVWAVATLTWRIVDVDTPLNFLAFVIMTTSGIKTLFNLNPLIKLDGYYLLSDYLEIPNLRQKSFAYLKTLVRHPGEGATNVTVRERRIYLVYGLLAGVYSTWLLTVIGLHFGRVLVGRYQGTGLLLFVGVLGLVFQHRITRTISAFRVRFVASPKDPARVKWSAIGTALAVILAALIVIPAELKISGEFRILPGQRTDVRAQVAGTIEDIYVEEGDVVRPGDRVARIADADFRADLGQVEAEVREHTARLNMLRAGPTRQEIQLAQSELQTARTRQQELERQFGEATNMLASRRSRAESGMTAAETRLHYEQKNLERIRELFKAGLISRMDLDRSEEQVRLRQRELEGARADVALIMSDNLSQLAGDFAVAKQSVKENEGRLRVLLAGNRPETIEAVEAEVARLEVRRRHLDNELQLTTITSSAAGVIATPRMKERRGSHVAKGDLIAEVHEVHRVTPEIIVSEKEIGEVRPGQQVVLKARAYPEMNFFGTVKAISPSASDSGGPDRRVFRVRVELDRNNDLLRPEMTGNAKIFSGERSMLQLFTRRVVRYVRVESWAWW
jgi:multidrug efflux pump subunit AcrA (membrane-fusion protein)